MTDIKDAAREEARRIWPGDLDARYESDRPRMAQRDAFVSGAKWAASQPPSSTTVEREPGHEGSRTIHRQYRGRYRTKDGNEEYTPVVHNAEAAEIIAKQRGAVEVRVEIRASWTTYSDWGPLDE